MGEVGKIIGIFIYVFGIEIYMMVIVGMVLGYWFIFN